MGLRGRWIGVDARDLAGGGTGIATYARGVLDAVTCQGGRVELLSPGASLPRPLRWGLAAWAGPFGLRGAIQPDGTGRVRLVADVFRVAQVHFDIWRRPLLCQQLTCHGVPIDLMHWSSPLPLSMRGVPNLVTVHDLIPLRHPGLTATDPQRYRRMLRRVFAKADRLLAVSDATRRDVEHYFPEAAWRCVTLHQAVRMPDSWPDTAGVASLLGCAPGDYFIATGSVEPRKNLPALLQAFLDSGSARKLVIVGPDGWRAADELTPFQRFMGAPGSGAPVLRLPFTERGVQLSLIRGARALLYPSLAEGFGLPILEAMALQTPVLCARGGATEEVAGGAAILVDPHDRADIAEAIRRLDQNDAFCADLRQKGAVRAADFSFTRYAQALAGIYEDVLKRAAR